MSLKHNSTKNLTPKRKFGASLKIVTLSEKIPWLFSLYTHPSNASKTKKTKIPAMNSNVPLLLKITQNISNFAYFPSQKYKFSHLKNMNFPTYTILFEIQIFILQNIISIITNLKSKHFFSFFFCSE